MSDDKFKNIPTLEDVVQQDKPAKPNDDNKTPAPKKKAQRKSSDRRKTDRRKEQTTLLKAKPSVALQNAAANHAVQSINAVVKK